MRPTAPVRALRLSDTEKPRARVAEIGPAEWPDQGDTLIAVSHSGVNYKDALAVTGRGPIVRGAYPFVPGIDLVGTVLASDGDLEPGERVIGTGWGIGETVWGGYAGTQVLPGQSLVSLPAQLAPTDAMTVGTAGLTAALAVAAIERGGVAPSTGEVVVTGASGGVGSFAVILLREAGYQVVASTGKTNEGDYLRVLGAHRIIDRRELSEPRRPMEKARWAAAVDCVGHTTLASILAETGRHGVVAACGLAGGSDLQTTVFPFILRGVVLAGIDSNTCPNPLRNAAWERIARVISREQMAAVRHQVIGLDDIVAASEEVLSGGIRGRVVVEAAA